MTAEWGVTARAVTRRDCTWDQSAHLSKRRASREEVMIGGTASCQVSRVNRQFNSDQRRRTKCRKEGFTPRFPKLTGLVGGAAVAAVRPASAGPAAPALRSRARQPAAKAEPRRPAPSQRRLRRWPRSHSRASRCKMHAITGGNYDELYKLIPEWEDEDRRQGRVRVQGQWLRDRQAPGAGLCRRHGGL